MTTVAVTGSSGKLGRHVCAICTSTDTGWWRSTGCPNTAKG
jgi:hypothetical protein